MRSHSKRMFFWLNYQIFSIKSNQIKLKENWFYIQLLFYSSIHINWVPLVMLYNSFYHMRSSVCIPAWRPGLRVRPSGPSQGCTPGCLWWWRCERAGWHPRPRLTLTPAPGYVCLQTGPPRVFGPHVPYQRDEWQTRMVEGLSTPSSGSRNGKGQFRIKLQGWSLEVLSLPRQVENVAYHATLTKCS